MLVEYFLKNLADQYGQKKKRVSKMTLRVLMEYEWPGNMRELKNTIERFVIMNPDELIDVKEIQPIKGMKPDYVTHKTLRDAS